MFFSKCFSLLRQSTPNVEARGNACGKHLVFEKFYFGANVLAIFLKMLRKTFPKNSRFSKRKRNDKYLLFGCKSVMMFLSKFSSWLRHLTQISNKLSNFENYENFHFFVRRCTNRQSPANTFVSYHCTNGCLGQRFAWKFADQIKRFFEKKIFSCVLQKPMLQKIVSVHRRQGIFKWSQALKSDVFPFLSFFMYVVSVSTSSVQLFSSLNTNCSIKTLSLLPIQIQSFKMTLWGVCNLH